METGKGDHWKHFNQACQTIMTKFPWTQKVIEDMKSKWGIPWIDNRKLPKKNHPRLLNAGWLVEDAEVPNIEELKPEYRCKLQKIIKKS
jgi:CRISPR-associated protein Cmr2